MNCIQKSNPGAGFIDQHRRFCGYVNGHPCDRDAVIHINVGHYCANVCARCCEKIAKGRKAEVVQEIFVVEVS